MWPIRNQNFVFKIVRWKEACWQKIRLLSASKKYPKAAKLSMTHLSAWKKRTTSHRSEQIQRHPVIACCKILYNYIMTHNLWLILDFSGDKEVEAELGPICPLQYLISENCDFSGEFIEVDVLFDAIYLKKFTVSNTLMSQLIGISKNFEKNPISWNKRLM